MAIGTPISSLVDLLYPRPCAVCNRHVCEAARHLCWECRCDVSLLTFPYCSWCGDPVQGQVNSAYVCSWCNRMPRAFDRARSAAHYEGPVQACVRAFKYAAATHLISDLGAMLLACIGVHFGSEVIDGVTYVPLHTRRRRERTYNQSELLGRYVSRRLGVALSDAGLYRTRHTPPQATLNARARRQNVAGAFAVKPGGWVEGRSLLLVDDVMTTGATVDAVADALKKAGAHRVWVATVARGV